MKSLLIATAAAAALLPLAARAQSLGDLAGYQAVSDGGVSNYVATPDVVGTTSTATVAGGGNPIYLATAPKYSGVVALIMNEGAAGNFICSGALLSDRRSIVTAGHCVSGGAGTANPISTTAYFYGGGQDIVVPGNAAATAVAVSNYYVDGLYTGQVIDQNDIAVLRLADAAPAFAQAYDIYTGNLQGQEYNIAGYGLRSDTGGSVGATPATTGVGRLRQGDNTYQFALGDSDFGGFWDGFFGTADVTNTWLSDFDSGSAANDTSCRIAAALGLSGAKYCDTGLGALEVSTAPGDSGGPEFVNGQIASVTSFGLSFGPNFGDVDNKLNDSFGEFNGFVPTAIHQDLIAHAMAAPEPGTWAMLIMGFGSIGLALRRRRTAATA
jgi:hypothetical protein